MNETFNRKYSELILPLYGKRRNVDIESRLLQDNILPHSYAVNDRVDMTSSVTYSIDPSGCEDADDAFSIYREEDKLFLAIHIADPTEYINPHSTLWRDVEERVVTRYPSNHKPIHMLPDVIMEQASLMENKYGNQKLAITILTEINSDTYCPCNKVKLLFTVVKVATDKSLSYCEAGELLDLGHDAIVSGARISEALVQLRSKKTKGVRLNEVSNSYPKFSEDGSPYLYKDTSSERKMKHMIAEFAIFANSFIGEYLKINFKGSGLYRVCAAQDWLNTVYTGISGQELLNEIIVNGIKAEYLSSVQSHDLVGAPEYCHFTSPIRRLTDCVCHYLLKYIHHRENKNKSLLVPFLNSQLEQYSSSSVSVSKSMKNIQYKDTKFRLFQSINHMLEKHELVNIKYYISSYTGSFLNIIICNINEHSAYISYTLRRHSLSTLIVIKEVKELSITMVNCMGKYDEGSLPELDILYQ
jgi:exoribonuclease R